MTIIEFFSSSSLLLITAFTPIILAFVQLSKKWIFNDRWYPVIAIVAGVVLSFFFSGLSDLSYRILLGVLAGLSASGLYAGGKTIVKDSE